MEKTAYRIFEEKLSVAPMMEHTNHMLRGLLRLITKHTVLYTEMINCETIVRLEDPSILLDFPIEQSPVVLQLGGCNAVNLGKSTALACNFPYASINLNAGCPSSKVQKGKFGAILMKEPDLVTDILNEMDKNSTVPISIKTRLGLDEFDKEFLDSFVQSIYDKTSVRSIIFHSRIALMGLDTVKNRVIPPIMYDVVKETKEKFPGLFVSVNGEVKTIQNAKRLLEVEGFDGAMLGRPAYEDPWLFSKADSVIFGKKDPGLSKQEVLLAYGDFVDNYNLEHKFNYDAKIKPLMNLFVGQKHNKAYKTMLNTKPTDQQELFSDKIKEVIAEFGKLNPEALEEF